MTRCGVLIIGAGPTGLVLALWLSKLGAKVRIVDKTAEPGSPLAKFKSQDGCFDSMALLHRRWAD
jgi:2-polyprenyl-6-methoxyphenol hydroxylase-like FAD-dependent oxidoreductase